MDFTAVQAQLNDLPPTFARPGPPYTQFVDAETSALTLFAAGTDGMVAQGASLATAQDGWLDAWGLIAGIPRNPGEANAPYKARILATLLAWIGTGPAIQMWLDLFAPGGTISENLPDVGYTLTLPAAMTAAQVLAFLVTLGRIRPAGVPFTISMSNSGLFLGTVNFFGEGRMQGAYLSQSVVGAPPGLSPMTNNSAPLLPTLYLSDPALNA